MRNYQEFLHKILTQGEIREDRTGVGTISLFGEQLRFDLSKGFPLLTTKRLHFKSIAVELLWMLRGDTNVKFLHDHGVTIWDEWASPDGELGPVYGQQWRAFGFFPTYESEIIDGFILRDETVDQIKLVEAQLRDSPTSRRIIVSAWNPVEVPDMALPPCHCLFQFYVTVDGRLSCHMYQRSADAFLGVPYNIASYAMLTQMFAYVAKFKLGELIISFGDAHIYRNHLPQVQTLLERTPCTLPNLCITNHRESVTDFEYKDFVLVGYTPQPSIAAEVAV